MSSVVITMTSTLKTVVVALVLSRLDYANSVLTGLPAYLVKMSTVGAQFFGSPDLISNALMSLHWLRIQGRIHFKLAVLVHRERYGNAPEYLRPFTRLYDVQSRSSLRSASSNHLLIPQVRRWTVGASAFAGSGPTLWNSSPSATLRTMTVCQFFVVV
jgi:hypothetical protein